MFTKLIKHKTQFDEIIHALSYVENKIENQEALGSFGKHMNQEGIMLRECNLEEDKVPFVNEAFDCALLTEVIEHLAYHKLLYVFSEVKRILKKEAY